MKVIIDQFVSKGRTFAHEGEIVTAEDNAKWVHPHPDAEDGLLYGESPDDRYAVCVRKATPEEMTAYSQKRLAELRESLPKWREHHRTARTGKREITKRIREIEEEITRLEAAEAK